MLDVRGHNGCGALTAPAAGTPFLVALPAKGGLKTTLDSLLYTPGDTSHTLTAMRALGHTTLSANAAASQAVINLTAQPGPTGNAIAANDFLVIRRASDGALFAVKVSSVATLAITLTAVLASALVAGDEVFFYGVPADTDPLNAGLTHPSFPLATGAQRTVSNATGNGVVSSNKNNEPMLLHINNVTTAGAFDRAAWLYTYQPGSSHQGFLSGSGEW